MYAYTIVEELVIGEIKKRQPLTTTWQPLTLENFEKLSSINTHLFMQDFSHLPLND